MLEALFQSIGTTNEFVVEFGVEDGRECNSAHLIRDFGWGGLLIEANEQHYRRLAAAYAGVPGLTLANRLVTAENVGGVFREYNVPADLDLLSIDVDGNDYWIWQALDTYQARVVVIEFNSAHPPPELWVMQYDPGHVWRGDSYYGASLASLTALGKRKGYALMATDTRGVNAFFLRRELLSGCRFPECDPHQAFHPPGFLNAQGSIGHPPGDGPFCRI